MKVLILLVAILTAGIFALLVLTSLRLLLPPKISTNEKRQNYEVFTLERSWLGSSTGLSYIVSGVVLLTVLLVWTIVGTPDDLGGGVLVELFGMLFDTLIIFLLFNILMARNEKYRDKKRLKEEFEDFRYWNEREASYRVSGILHRLNAYGIQELNIRDYYFESSALKQLEFKESKIWNTPILKCEVLDCLFLNTELFGVHMKETEFRFCEFRAAYLFDVSTIGKLYGDFMVVGEIVTLSGGLNSFIYRSLIESGEIGIDDHTVNKKLWNRVNFIGSKVEKSIFYNLVIKRSEFTKSSTFKDCIFINVEFIDCTISNCLFEDSVFVGVGFVNCTFISSNLQQNTFSDSWLVLYSIVDTYIGSTHYQSLKVVDSNNFLELDSYNVNK